MVLKSVIKRVVLAVVPIIASGALILWGLSDFELSGHTVSTHRFNVAGAKIEGTLVIPADCTNPPVAAIVHGDGPQDRWSDTGYMPIVNAMLDSCIGVFSWDKPGIGESTGHWLSQSMVDRSDIADAAIQYLRTLPYLSAERIGFLGFSQAGWVIPKATTMARPAFSVLVGAATNWRAQGVYFTERKLQRAGYGTDEIAKIAADELVSNDAIFGSAPESVRSPPPGMHKDRFEFVRLNYSADARADLSALQGPLLAIWGANDLNVDPDRNADIYNQKLNAGDRHQVVILSSATHGLLRSRWFNYQITAEWPLWAKVLFACLGRRAYAPESIPLITGWINTMVQ